MKPLSLTELYPPLGLVVRTPDLVLQVADEYRGARLASNSREGIHAPGFYPFASSWSDAAPEVVAQRVFRNVTSRAWKPGDPWSLNFVVHLRPTMYPIGVMSLRQRDDGAVGTGSWLLLSQQGKGYGTQARAAALKLAFEGMRMLEAVTSAYTYNAPSLGVTRKLGYTEVLSEPREVNGETVTSLMFSVSPDSFRDSEAGRCFGDGIWWTGLEPVLVYFGIEGEFEK